MAAAIRSQSTCGHVKHVTFAQTRTEYTDLHGCVLWVDGNGARNFSRPIDTYPPPAHPHNRRFFFFFYFEPAVPKRATRVRGTRVWRSAVACDGRAVGCGVCVKRARKRYTDIVIASLGRLRANGRSIGISRNEYTGESLRIRIQIHAPFRLDRAKRPVRTRLPFSLVRRAIFSRIENRNRLVVPDPLLFPAVIGYFAFSTTNRRGTTRPPKHRHALAAATKRLDRISNTQT